MYQMGDHTSKINKIQEQLCAWYKEGKDSVSLSFGHHTSNVTRKKDYNVSDRKLDCSSLNQVLIDTNNKIAYAEPRVTMERLVQATLAHGLIPKVVPEFKNITVGGAINGGAAESSSHRWGIFSDTCSSYEVILGDGSCLKVTAEKNSDLFYGLSGCYGSLGLITEAGIELVEAKPWVLVNYTTYTIINEAVDALQKLYKSPNPPDFLDGIIFSSDHAVIISGSMKSDEEVKKIPRAFFSQRSSPWYYQYVKDATSQKSGSIVHAIPLVDYLFRYDQGAFWMGSYLLHPQLFFQFVRYGVLKLGIDTSKGFEQDEITKYSRIHGPGYLLRSLFHNFMSSNKLYGVLHKGEQWVANHTIIQDFCIPEQHLYQFIEHELTHCKIFPLWLCPIKATNHHQIFAPHATGYTTGTTTHYINLGVYGIPQQPIPPFLITCALEKAASSLGGRKVFYSHSYYSLEEFWKIYACAEYEALRKKYKGEGVWKEITQKILQIPSCNKSP